MLFDSRRKQTEKRSFRFSLFWFSEEMYDKLFNGRNLTESTNRYRLPTCPRPALCQEHSLSEIYLACWDASFNARDEQVASPRAGERRMGAAVPELSEHRDGPQCRACKLYGRELRTRGDDKSCDAIPVEIRVGHGLGPSMGWVGLGWVETWLRDIFNVMKYSTVC